MKKIIKFKSFDETKAKWLKYPAVKKAYDDLELEFALISAMIDYRIKKGITQKQLAEKIGTKQSSIARFESGNYNPTLAFVQKIAHAVGAKIEVRV